MLFQIKMTIEEYHHIRILMKILMVLLELLGIHHEMKFSPILIQSSLKGELQSHILNKQKLLIH